MGSFDGAVLPRAFQSDFFPLNATKLNLTFLSSAFRSLRRKFAVPQFGRVAEIRGHGGRMDKRQSVTPLALVHLALLHLH